MKKTVRDSFSGVQEGQILRYMCRGFAVYDGMWCFNFQDPKGERLYWCIHESKPIEKWHEVFEEKEPEPNQTPHPTTL